MKPIHNQIVFTEKCYQRLTLLHQALVYDSEEKKIFTDVDRIYINQERGSLLDQVNYCNKLLPANKVRDLTVPAAVNEKIKKFAQRRLQ